MDALELLADVLGAVPISLPRCQWADCQKHGERHRNGVWCKQHAARMERYLTSCVACGVPADWRQYGCCYRCAREVWRLTAVTDADDDDR
jgi:hypothetical protein